MKEYKTLPRKTYVITPRHTCTVTTAEGTIIATCPACMQTALVAPANLLLLSDDEALVTEACNVSSPPAPGDSTTQPPLPEGALRWSLIEKHLSINAQPGAQGIPAAANAPSAVYISRVPWARWEGEADTGQWVNNASEVNEDVFGVARKLMDNAGLQHQCSTDTVEGVDDYNGKRWPFYWQHANYITDEHGIKHLTAIKGIHDAFDPYTQNTAAFGPAFWFFCCLERSQAADGTWRTHDGTESGTPLFQLWGISARPWEELDAGRRAQLTALGVTKDALHLWPECQVWDARKEQLVPRPYWCHSAYCGGYEEDASGKATLVSKAGLPLYNNLSCNSFNALYNNRAGFGGSACVNGFGMLFDIVKNATKNSQSIHQGMANNYCSAVMATQSTAQPDYLFPLASKEHFRPGCTVWLWQTTGNSETTTCRRSVSVQIGRIGSIETRTLLLTDGTTAESLCLVIDPATVSPFVVRTGADATSAIAATKELTDAGTHACCFATQGMALTGETDVVMGRHDGSRYSNADGRHVYRVQGTEYMPGLSICAADVQTIKGDAATSMEVDGIVCTPSSAQYVLLQRTHGSPYLSRGNIGQYLENGYRPVGLTEITGGYILNAWLSASGVAYPIAAGGTGSGSNAGHADNCWTGASPAEFLMAGSLAGSTHYGSMSLHLLYTPSQSRWFIGARD